MPGTEQPVSPPPLKPSPTGLLVAAQVINIPVPANVLEIDGMSYVPADGPMIGLGDRNAEHWLRGTGFSPESAVTPTLVRICSEVPGGVTWYQPPGGSLQTGVLLPGSTGTAAASNTRRPIRYQHPFEIDVWDECSAFGHDAADYQGRALRALLAKEQWAVEAEFERPTIEPNNNGLAQLHALNPDGTNATNPDGTTQDLSVRGTGLTSALALAYLNEAIATADIGQGMIHCTAFLAERWQQTQGIRFDGTTGKLVSANGNIIVAGNGYTGKGYDNTGGSVFGGGPTPIQWAYATDLIQIRRAAVPTLYPGTDDWRAALDRNTDTVTFRATRPYVMEWNGLCHAAVTVNVLT
jgi:hypothetical protein